MKVLILIASSMLLNLTCFAQFNISGTIVEDESGTALFGANIVLVGFNKATASDQNGSFKISNLKENVYTIKVTYVGFQPFFQKIELSTDVELNIIMLGSAIMTDEVIVSATRAQENTPMTYSVVKKEELAKLNFGQDIPYILNQQPSVVSTSDAGAGIGYTSIRIRGSDATRINVTINGIPLNDAEAHGVYWVDLPDLTSSLESIQIQRGVGTSTNGPGAFGASINILTAKYQEKSYGEFNTSWGSFDTRKYTLAAGTGLIDDHFTFDLRLSQINSDGYLDRAYSKLNSYYASAGYYGKHTLLKFNLISGHEETYQAWWGVPQSRIENDTEGMANYIINNGLNSEEADNLLMSGRTYNYYTYDNEIDNYGQDHYQMLFSQDISEKVRFNSAFFHTHGEGYFEQYREDDNYSDYGLSDPVIGIDTITSTDLIRQRWLDNDLWGLNYSFDFMPSEQLDFILGGSMSRYKGKHFGEIIWSEIAQGTQIRERFYNNLGEKSDFNIFLKANYALNERWFLFGDLQFRTIAYKVAGIDIDQRELNVDEKLNFINPKLGLTYAISAGEKFYASYSVGNREPVRNDYLDAPSGRLPLPESLGNLEVGYRLSTVNTSFNANFYYMGYRNQLVLTGELNDVGASIRANVNSSYRTGLELQLGRKLSNKFDLDINAAFSQNKIKEFEEILYDYGLNWDEYNEVSNIYTDTDISFSPNIVAGGSFNYFPVSKFEISWLLKYVGKQYLDNTSNDDRVINSYFVNDLRFIYSLNPTFMREIRLSLLVNNIFNSLYESNGYTYGYMGGGSEIHENLYYPQAGTNFLASLSLKF